MINTKTLDRISQDANKMKNDFMQLAKDSTTKINRDIERIACEAQDTVTTRAKSVAKDVGQGLSQYNSRVDNLVAKMPGNINTKASRYPWVALSIVLVVGLLLGVAIGGTGSSSR